VSIVPPTRSHSVFNRETFLVKEGDPPVVAIVELAEDVGIEQKCRQDGQAAVEGGVQGGVVFEAKVAAKPVDGDGNHAKNGG